MKISDIKTYVVGAGHRNCLFVKVMTDEGVFGIGEAYSVGPDLAVVETVSYFRDWLVGLDPTNIEYIWAKLYNFSRFPGGSVINAAISGIELALWDIAGKASGLPVYKLLGGQTRERIWAYGRPSGATIEETVADALQMQSEYGYTAFKVGVHPPEAERIPYQRVLRYAENKMTQLRKALGDDAEIAVDIHARVFEPAFALQMADVLLPYRPFFIEEPIRPENIRQMAKLAGKMKAPLATGECLYTKYEFAELLASEAVDIIQPDICITGGLIEMKKIAALAEANYVSVAPHNPMGPLATVANVHLAAAIPNFLILEHILDVNPPRSELLIEPLSVTDGYIALPDKPGWGVELNEEVFAKYPPVNWNRGFLTRADGSIAFV